jgi:hypothetical protein
MSGLFITGPVYYIDENRINIKILTMSVNNCEQSNNFRVF